MEHQEKILDLLNKCFGITLAFTSKENFKQHSKKLNETDFSKLNAGFQIFPQLLKNSHDKEMYSGTYKVIYNKGLGELQRSANNPNFFRANIVTPGTNNDIKGQALLQEFNPSELMKVSNLAMSAFTVAAIATSQYYLTSIDNKLTDIEKKVDEIKSFLEIDKESQLWADGEFLRDIKNSVEFIINDEAYRQATLSSIQSIRRTTLANIKLFHEQLSKIKAYLDIKDNDKKTSANLDKYQQNLPRFWYSVYLFELSYYLEVFLAKITDEKFFEKSLSEMKAIIEMFNDAYSSIDKEISKYIDEVKALKANEVPAKLMKELGNFLKESGVPTFNPGMFFAAKGIGFALEFGGNQLEKSEKTKKSAKKQDVLSELEKIKASYSDLEPLNFQVEAVKTINAIYNDKVEVIITENEAYLNYDLQKENN